MPSIIDSGVGRNLTNTVVGERLQPDPTERKFVTYVNDLGGVHTIIVDVEHAAETADELIQWFEHTRGLVTSSASVPSDPNHIPPEQVLAAADARMGWGKKSDAPPEGDTSLTNPSGG